jgi:hypothetical protein
MSVLFQGVSHWVSREFSNHKGNTFLTLLQKGSTFLHVQ